MAGGEIERVALLHEWPQVRGIRVVVTETTERPRTVALSIMGTNNGWSDVVRIDSSDPDSKARAISLGEIIQDALEAAEMTWFPYDTTA
ncbi:hypothetical protein MKK64_26445 [Methylobacterium sp. E-025]|uniref:hypothetical protein n=1 Tax=Methylobacterium sp. E-025 TaxID=2836561 RepID=UPI001FB9C405|nr:hypothetical protein [Methylobacterium sp. E-025]MCJ2114707.1 hypothetical protein [Methylobacterium sp. E-025]